MKKELYLLVIAFLGVMSFSNAQAENPECRNNLSIFFEYAKAKNYEAAYGPWKMVYDNCPDSHSAIYSYGERILKDKIEKAPEGEKAALTADLMGMYDNSLKYFPKKFSKAGVLIDKALFKYDAKSASDQELYDMLHKAFTEDKANFTNAKALYLYFSTLVDLHKAGSKDLQEVFDAYDDVTEKIAEENKGLTETITPLLAKEEAGTLTAKEKRALKNANITSEAYGKIEDSIDAKLGALADCENLIPLYEKSFEAKKGDVAWVKRAVGRMFSKECTDDPMFKKLFEAQLALDPSADAYMYGGTLKIKSGDSKGALADFNKAVELETDNYKKSNILYKIATQYRHGSKSTARSYAQKAIDANPANGKAYMLIASLYAGSANDCGTSSFEKRAIYWKAADMARQAGRVDPSLSGKASQAAASYNAKAPNKEMIFSSGMAGKTVTFSCWVGGSIKVPNL